MPQESETTPSDDNLEKLCREIAAIFQQEGDWPWEAVMTKIRDYYDSHPYVKVVQRANYLPTMDEAYRFMKLNPLTSSDMMREIDNAKD